MTAMMAFFLVLWIINATDKDTKTVIARYFNPVKLENPSKAKKGVHGSTSTPTEGEEKKADKAAGEPSKSKKPDGAPPPPKAEKKSEPAAQPPPSPETKAQAEAQLFAAPYEALDRIAGAPGAAAPGASPDKGDADPQRLNGALSIDSFRDPFKPIGPGSPDDPVAFDADARNKAPPDLEPGKIGANGGAKPAARGREGRETAGRGRRTRRRAPTPGRRSRARARTQTRKPRGTKARRKSRRPPKAAWRRSRRRSNRASRRRSAPARGRTSRRGRPRRGCSSASPTSSIFRCSPSARRSRGRNSCGRWRRSPRSSKTTPGHIVVRGHTDSLPYRGGAYDNWRLSSDRAQMAYYMLTRGGAASARFIRVEGYADRALKDPAHPLAAVNRRLEILVEEPK